jgi:transposase-like protein
MDASHQFCPHLACSARGKIGDGNIRIHCRKRERYRCRSCDHICSARRGTMLEGLRKPTEFIVIVVTLLAYGCSIQAIVHAYDLDERTIANWRDRAGAHCLILTRFHGDPEENPEQIWIAKAESFLIPPGDVLMDISTSSNQTLFSTIVFTRGLPKIGSTPPPGFGSPRHIARTSARTAG